MIRTRYSSGSVEILYITVVNCLLCTLGGHQLSIADACYSFSSSSSSAIYMRVYGSRRSNSSVTMSAASVESANLAIILFCVIKVMSSSFSNQD